MNSFTLRQLFDFMASELSSVYIDNELQAIRRLLFDKVLGIPFYQVHINPNSLLDMDRVDVVLSVLDKIKKGIPVQYAIGEADFMDLTFQVNPSVLIPRPETEELVRWIIENNNDVSPKILDIGTGSGCIAISLAKNITSSKVTALDISVDALAVARQNAIKNSVNIDFINTNILEDIEIYGVPYDIIVSNPPYVRELEKQQMHANVTDFEPHLALFVSDTNPLLFYRTIALNASKWLNPGGQLYFEINEAFGAEIKELLVEIGFRDVAVRKDINGKNRMAFGRL